MILQLPEKMILHLPEQLDPAFHIPAHMQSQCQCSGCDSHYITKLNIHDNHIHFIYILFFYNSNAKVLHLHVSETLDAQHGLFLSRKHDVQLFMEC